MATWINGVIDFIQTFLNSVLNNSQGLLDNLSSTLV